VHRVLLLVSATVLVDTMFFAAITPLLPAYQDELGLSKTAAGLLSAAYPAGTLIASLPAGWLAGRIGAKQTTATGLALVAVTSVAFGHATSIELLDGARFVQGLGGACTWAGGLAWLIGVTPADRRGQTIGAALGAAVFGVLLGPVIGGAATATSPQLVFSLVGALAVVLLAWAATTPGAARRRQSSWRELATALRARRLQMAVWLFTLPAFFIGAVHVLVPLRLDDLGARGLTIGALFVAAAGVEAALNPVMGRLSDDRGRLPLLRIGLIGAAAGAVLLPLPAGVWLLGAVLIAAVLALSFFWAPAAALLSDASESSGLDQGFAFGLMNLAWAAGQVLGGAGGGALADATADAVPYAILALLCVLTLVAVRAGRRVRA
jgi:MFS family permease